MLGESLQRFAIVLIGVAVWFQLSGPGSQGFIMVLAAVILGLIGVIIDVVG